MEFLSQKLQAVLTELGYTELTQIQELVIPKIKEGKSLVVGAPTGYGKTLAAFLPLLDKLDPDKPGVQLIYVTPLRSLNRDIFKNIIKISNKMGVEVDIRHGDTTAYERANQVRMPPHCLITTPETIQSIFLSKRFVEHIKNVRYVIVDEVQSLMESKRGTQFSVVLERLKEKANFQTVGISATIADFEATKKFLGCKEHVYFGGDKKYDIEVAYPRIENEDEAMAAKENLSEVVANSLRYIENAIKDSKSTIVFTNTRETAELLGSRLVKFLRDKKMEVHHSSLSKEVRTEIESRFKAGDVDLMIATSSLELGIDVGEVDLVIQYMSPRQVVKLVQRVGRSNHNQSGVAEGRLVTINLDDYLESLAINKCRLENRLELIKMPMNSLDILVHQIVGIIIDGVDNKDGIFKIIKRSYAFEGLDKKIFEKAIDFLIKHYMVRYYGDKLIRTKKGLLFYISNISTIPNKKTYVVIDSQLNRKIGVLDEEFIAENGRAGNQFVMRGETWRIIKAEDQKITVVRANNSIGAIPAWTGELMPVYRFVAEQAAELRKDYTDKFSVLKEQNDNYILPDPKKMLMERIEEFVIIHSTFGNKTNEALSKVLATEIASITAESVVTKIDPYRIIVKTSLPMDKLRDIILNIEDPEKTIKETVRRTSLYEYRFLNVAKRFGVVNKYADFTKMHLRSLIDLYSNSLVEYETYNEIFSDKIDIKSVNEILDDLRSGKIKLIVNDGEPSPLSYEGIENSYGGSLVKPEEAKKLLRGLVTERLKNTRMFLQCMNCGHKIGEMNAGDTDEIKCTKCKARYIGFYKAKYFEKYDPIVKKGLKNKKLQKDERLIFEGIKQSGALYLGYDGKACLVSASYGIGPRMASRVLSAYSKNEYELTDKIIEAEKNYIETREYWN